MKDLDVTPAGQFALPTDGTPAVLILSMPLDMASSDITVLRDDGSDHLSKRRRIDPAREVGSRFQERSLRREPERVPAERARSSGRSGRQFRHGGGEGRVKGYHPMTPWGVPTLGYKTRNNKRTDQFIVKRKK